MTLPLLGPLPMSGFVELLPRINLGLVLQQVGYQMVRGDASMGWMRVGAVLLAAAALAAVLIHRQLPS